MSSAMQGRIAVVTGGSRGIGAAIARKLCREGMRVAIVGRVRADLELMAGETGAVPIVSNVAEPGSAEAILAAVRAVLGEPDVVVPNAGIDASYKIADTSDAIWDEVMTVNATAAFRMCRAALPHMIARGFGRIVVVASNAGLRGYPYSAAYCASKHAAVGMVRAIAAEIARTPVTINAVCPGFVDTSMSARAVARLVKKTGRTQEQAKAAIAAMSPQERLIHPDEVAHAVFSLCQPDARGIHGQAIAIDGGATGG